MAAVQRPILSSVVLPSNYNPNESKKLRVFLDITTWLSVHFYKGTVIIEINSNRNAQTGWRDIERVSINVDELNWLTQSEKLATSYGRIKITKVKGGVKISRSDDWSNKANSKKGKLRSHPYETSDKSHGKRKERFVTLSAASLEALRKTHRDILQKCEEVKTQNKSNHFQAFAGDDVDFYRKLLIVCAKQIYKGVHVTACNTCTGYNGDVEICTNMHPDMWRESCNAALYAVTHNMLSSLAASNGFLYPKLSNTPAIGDDNPDELLRAMMSNEMDESALTVLNNHFNDHNVIAACG